MSNFDTKAWIEKHFKIERWRGDEADVHCRLHDDQHASCSINVSKRVYKCLGCNSSGTLSNLARDLGIELPPYSGNGKGKLTEISRFNYVDVNGKVLYQVVRFAPKSFRQFNPETGEWSVKGLPRVPYRLPELLAGIKAAKVVWICEGEKDTQNLVKLGFCATCNAGGVGSVKQWRGFARKYFPAGTKVVLIPDADKPGQEFMAEVGKYLVDAGCKVKLVHLGYPVAEKHGRDTSVWLAEGHTRDELIQLTKAAQEFIPDEEDFSAEPEEERGKKKQPKQADLAVQLGSAADLFHDGDVAYARIPISGHRETWKVRGKEFKTWLRRQFYNATETAIGSQALDDALGVLEGKALFEGAEIATHVRITGDDRTVYLDLGNDAWQVVAIDAQGWKILEEAPVRFRRPPGMGALPTPVGGGQLAIHLESFLNMDADDRKLFTACLINAFRPTGPYPVLCLHGEQGSAKSTAARIFRACIDPNTAMLRSTPREERDLLIAGTNGWVVAFDNLSHLPTWVSDALCRIATGSGFGIRQLYADDAEILFQVQRPIVLNGIEDLASRGDLLDRSVLVYLPAIPEERRLTERNFLAQFEEALPLILGSLLEAVSAAIRNLGDINLPSIPRMADFCEWICAAEPALGWEAGTFLNIYRRNRADANALALEATPIVPALTKLLDNTAGEWQGTATELHEALSTLVSEKTQKSKAWPRSGRSTSASLKRLAPNLRQVGVWAEWDRTNQVRTIRLKLKSIVTAVFASPSSRKTGQAGNASDANDAKTQVFDLGLNAYDDTP